MDGKKIYTQILLPFSPSAYHQKDILHYEGILSKTLEELRGRQLPQARLRGGSSMVYEYPWEGEIREFLGAIGVCQKLQARHREVHQKVAEAIDPEEVVYIEKNDPKDFSLSNPYLVRLSDLLCDTYGVPRVPVSFEYNGMRKGFNSLFAFATTVGSPETGLPEEVIIRHGYLGEKLNPLAEKIRSAFHEAAHVFQGNVQATLRLAAEFAKASPIIRLEMDLQRIRILDCKLSKQHLGEPRAVLNWFITLFTELDAMTLDKHLNPFWKKLEVIGLDNGKVTQGGTAKETLLRGHC